MVTPLITNLKRDPFERFHEARGFDEWQENRSWTLAPANAQVSLFLKSLKEFPPRQRCQPSEPENSVLQMRDFRLSQFADQGLDPGDALPLAGIKKC